MSSLAGKYRRYIVLPLTHVGRAEEEQQQADEIPRTAVINSIKKSARTAIQAAHKIHYNPEGTLESSGVTQPEYERLINNMLLGVSNGLFTQPKIALFVTNAMKFVDVIDIDKQHVRFLTEQLNQYLEDTDQTPANFRLGVIQHTTHTTHTCYLELAVVHDPETVGSVGQHGEVVDYPYTLARILFGSVPIGAKNIQYRNEGYYPIQVVLSSINVQFVNNSDGSLQYSYSAAVYPKENKRATL